jgi:hypothetical protein
VTEATDVKQEWETPTLTVLGDLTTLTAAGPDNGDDGSMVSGVI